MCIAEKHKALKWKMKTACLLFLCSFYFILVWLIVKRGLVNNPLGFSFIHLFNKFEIRTWMEKVGNSCWFCTLSNENVNSTKASQLFIVLNPTLQKWQLSNDVTSCKINLRVPTKKCKFVQVLFYPDGNEKCHKKDSVWVKYIKVLCNIMNTRKTEHIQRKIYFVWKIK